MQKEATTGLETTTRFVESLIAEIGQDRFDIWFDHSDSIEIDSQSLAVNIKFTSEFSLDYVSKTFGATLRKLTIAELGQQAEFNLSISDAQKDQSPEPKAESAQPESKVNVAQKPKVESAEFVESSSSHLQVPVTFPLQASPSKTGKRRWASLATFVIDDRNFLAAGAANQVVANLGEITPLFLSGPNGSGKTHLLEGIFQNARQLSRSGRVLYLTASQYMTQFLEALHQRSMPSFRKKFRELDVLLIDDIQFFDQKKATVIELVQTIDALLKQGTQLVLSADRTLSELQFLGGELITRISSGLICRLDYPQTKARKEILQRMASTRNITVDDSVAEFVAAQITGDVRHLSGAINRLIASHVATGREINVANATNWLSDLIQANQRIPTLHEIQNAVSEVLGIERDTLCSNQRVRSVTHPRMLAMWLSRQYTRASLSEIGDFFGKRKHSTVLSAKKKVNHWIEDGQKVQTQYGEVLIEDAIRQIKSHLNVG